MPNILKKAKRKMSAEAQTGLPAKVSEFLQQYYIAETYARLIIRTYRHEQTRNEIRDKIVKQQGKKITNRLAQSIAGSLNMQNIKTYHEATRFNIKDLIQALEAEKVFDEGLLMALFSTSRKFQRRRHKSARILRNEIVHGMRQSAIQEVLDRHAMFTRLFETFLGKLKTSERQKNEKHI